MSDLKKYTDYKTILVVNALIFSQGKVLYHKRAMTKKVDPGSFNGIGGKVEPGESFFDAIIREIFEETGIKVKENQIRFYGLTQTPDLAGSKAEWIHANFVINIPRIVETTDTKDGEYRWVTFNEIAKAKTAIDIRHYLKILQKNPHAFVLGYFNFGYSGELIQKEVRIY